jgi:hypothetical protein
MADGTSSARGRQGSEEVRIPKTYSASEIAERLEGLLSEQRLVELAELGYMPCWRIEGRVRFQVGEVKKYLADNMLVHQRGRPLPAVVEVLVEKAQRPLDVPPALLPMATVLHPLPLWRLPTAIYFLIKGDAVVYVGQSVALAARIAQHHEEKDFDRVLFLPVARENLDATEGAFIRALRPPLNRQTPCRLGTDDAATLAQCGFRVDGQEAQ